MPAGTRHHRGAPPLDRLGDHGHRLGIGVAADLGELVERGLDLLGVVPVDGHNLVAVRLQLRGDHRGRLLLADAVGLAVLVAVEDRQHVAELVVLDVVERLGDLTLAALAVADDAVDALVHAVEAGGVGQAGGDRETLAEAACGGIEEGEAFHGVRVTVDLAVGLAELHRVGDGHGAAVLRVLADLDAELGAGGIDDGDGVPFGEHEPV